MHRYEQEQACRGAVSRWLAAAAAAAPAHVPDAQTPDAEAALARVWHCLTVHDVPGAAAAAVAARDYRLALLLAQAGGEAATRDFVRKQVR